MKCEHADGVLTAGMPFFLQNLRFEVNVRGLHVTVMFGLYTGRGKLAWLRIVEKQ